MYFNRNVGQALEIGEPRLVGLRRLRLVADDRSDERSMPRPHTPQMKVGDAVAADFKLGPDARGKLRIDDGIQENGSSVSQQPQRPVGDDERADDAHHWIHPRPAEEAARQQRRDSEDRGQGIGEHVQVRGA